MAALDAFGFGDLLGYGRDGLARGVADALVDGFLPLALGGLDGRGSFVSQLVCGAAGKLFQNRQAPAVLLVIAIGGGA